ncbi:hypothetical protein ACFQ7N_10300 [Streptomyces niveus]|uniref:hypothetical protein n=1 Tax=Streptomyces niveus TaxID=193462 RepID=UPI0036B9B859
MNTTSSRTLTHRTTLEVPDDDGFLDTVRRVTTAWLSSKYRSTIPLGTGQHHLDDMSLLVSQAAYGTDGSETATRLQLRQDTPAATWRTTVTAVRAGQAPGAVCVDLECFPNGDAPVRPAKPRLVGDLVQELRPADGPSPLTTNPLRVASAQIGSLLDVLCDPERHQPVIVAARPLRADPLWSRRIADTVKPCAGDASFYLLWDTEAVDEFRSVIGEDHRVAPGVVRTFLPDVDPAWAPDAARHRFIVGTRWSDPTDHAWRGAAGAVQRMAIDRPPPDALRTVTFPDPAERQRQERRESLDKVRLLSAVPSQGPGPDDGELRAEVKVLNGLLEEADGELAEAARSAELAARTNDSLSGQLQAAVGELDSEVEDHLNTLAALQAAQDEADELRRLLLRQGRWEDVAAAEEKVPTVPIPSSFEELWERLDGFIHLTVTADRRTALGLDEHALARTWAAKTWNALRALDSYAEASTKGFAGGFRHFCLTPPRGAKSYPAKQVAMNETTSTMTQYGHERLFTGADGVKVYMQAHLKIGLKGRIAPRLYFDHSGGELTVGYIGPHLSNCRTS